MSDINQLTLEHGLIALNKRFDLVLCLECDQYVGHSPTDNWSTYKNKIVKHLNKHRGKLRRALLSEIERSQLTKFLNREIGDDLNLLKPSGNFHLLSTREGLQTPNLVLYKSRKSNIAEALLCGVEQCIHTVLKTKNWRHRLREHCKQQHRERNEDEAVAVLVQELHLNSFFLIGKVGCETVHQSGNEMCFINQQTNDFVPAPPQESERLHALDILHSHEQEEKSTYIAKWEKFLRKEISIEKVKILFSDSIEVSKQIDELVQAWFQTINEEWTEKVEDNYSLQDTIMRHMKDETFHKIFKISAVKSKGVKLVHSMLLFGCNWFFLYSKSEIPAKWAGLFDSSAISCLSALTSSFMDDAPARDLSQQTVLVYDFLESLTSLKVQLKDAIITCLMPSAFLIAWVFREGLDRVNLHLRNVSSLAYAFENVCRLHCCIQYVRSGDIKYLERVRLNNENDAIGPFPTSLELAHQIFKRTKPFVISPHLKMEPIESADTSLHRFQNGSRWSIDRQRMALDEVLAEFDDELYNITRGFRFFDASYGVFNETGDIILQDTALNDRPGFGLTVPLDELEHASDKFSGRTPSEFSELRRVDKVMKVCND